VWRQATYFDQFEAERLDLGEYTIKRSLVGEHARQHGVVAPPLGLEGGERGADRLAQAAADRDRVILRLRTAVRTGHLLTAHEAAHPPVAALGMTSLMVPPRCCAGHSAGERPHAVIFGVSHWPQLLDGRPLGQRRCPPGAPPYAAICRRGSMVTPDRVSCRRVNRVIRTSQPG
jgi:hypothetical protein